MKRCAHSIVRQDAYSLGAIYSIESGTLVASAIVR
jgi:hypothetical protein